MCLLMVSAKNCLQEGVCYMGQLTAIETLKAMNWAECQMQCGVDYECQKWSFLEDTKQCTKISMRFVKPIPGVGCISGDKFCGLRQKPNNGKSQG